MTKGVPITENEKQAIALELEKKPNALLIARKTGWSFSTVWRVAEWAGIELTAGREAKGYKRLAPRRAAKVIKARRENPDAPQIEIARAAGVSRSTVWRIEGGSPRRRGITVAKLG